MTAPAIKINGGSPGAKAALSPSTSYSATLDSTAGVRTVEWSILSTDETSTVASYTLTPSGTVGQTVTFTTLGTGTAAILHVKINGGYDSLGVRNVAETEATAKFGVLLPNGLWVGAANEKLEHDATTGSTGLLNAGLRVADGLSGGALSRSVRVATAAALPANTRSGNVLTADVNGALGTIDGVAVIPGDKILVQTEGGGASHINNGSYTFTSDGDGSNPWVLTRADDFNETTELVAGVRWYVQEGATYAGKERLFVTTGATINVTALEFAAFGYGPNDATYLIVGSNALLTAEKNISAVTTTLPFASTSVAPISVTRTNAATAADVDVLYLEALSTGTTAAGFGAAARFYAQKGAGASETTGTLSIPWTNVGGGAEATKLVVKTRTGGAAAATALEVSETEMKATALAGVGTRFVTVTAAGVLGASATAGADAAAKYWEDTTTALNTNGVPIQATPSKLTIKGASAIVPLRVAYHRAAGAHGTGLEIYRSILGGSGAPDVGTSASLDFVIPDDDASPTDTVQARWRPLLTTIAGANLTSDLQLYLVNAGSLDLAWTFKAGGGATAVGIVTALGGLRAPSVDADSAAALVVGGTNATSIVVDSTTGVVTLKKGGTLACTETWEPTGASSIVPVAGSTSFTIQQAQLGGTGATAGNTTTLAAQKGQNVAAGPNNAGGNLVLASGDHGSGGVDGQPGSVLIKVGTANAINCAGDGSTTSFGADVVEGTTFQASSKFTGPQLDRANAGALTLGGTNATSIAGSGLPFTGVLSIDNNGAAQTVGANTTSLTLASTGTIARTLAASQIDRVSFGAAGVNYIDLMPKVITTNNATATNAITLAMADHSAAIFEVRAYCYIVGTETSRAYFHWYSGFNRAGGAPTRDYHTAAAENGGADVVVGVWGSPPTLAIVAGAPGANDVSVQVTGVLATSIKWTVIARYHITTTSA